MKLLKKKWFWAIAIILVIVFLSLREKEITHIVLNDRVTKVAIPSEIVKSKDCNKYHEWFYAHATPLAAWSDRCPWSKPPKGPIGEFIVKGEKFWIPREYLWQDRKISDGHHRSLHLLMIFPEMKPVTGKKEEGDYEVMVTIESTYYWNKCRLESACNTSQYSYEHNTDIKKLVEHGKIGYPKKLGYLPETDLTIYDFRTVRDFYIRGDVEKPSYWLACDGGVAGRNWNPGCESEFNLNDNLHIEYVFRKTYLLNSHDQVREKIIKKIKEWQTPIESE